MSARSTMVVLGGAAIAAVLAFTGAAPAFAAAVPGTATLTAGTFTMTLPASLTFTGTLTGAAQVLSANQAIDVLDNTGSGAGWNVTLTSTTFTSGSNTLATTASTDTAATSACDTVGSCVLANNAAVTYPVTVPAAVAAPTAIKIQTAAASTGMSNQTWTHVMHLAVPAQALAGAYTSTWTYSLVSAP